MSALAWVIWGVGVVSSDKSGGVVRRRKVVSRRESWGGWWVWSMDVDGEPSWCGGRGQVVVSVDGYGGRRTALQRGKQ
ncbi:hypothetical protein C8F01DRAFT_1151652 [Mycena amicta]|nr:hypothetical protein C8F01DRAFT_1151652 [Mycena amicta]